LFLLVRARRSPCSSRFTWRERRATAHRVASRPLNGRWPRVSIKISASATSSGVTRMRRRSRLAGPWPFHVFGIDEAHRVGKHVPLLKDAAGHVPRVRIRPIGKIEAESLRHVPPRTAPRLPIGQQTLKPCGRSPNVLHGFPPSGHHRNRQPHLRPECPAALPKAYAGACDGAFAARLRRICTTIA
jgi:hypothetical protein